MGTTVCPAPLAENGVATGPITEGSDPAAVHLHVLDGAHTCHSSLPDPWGVHTVYLPKKVIALCQNPTAHSIPIHDTKPCPSTSLLVADLGMTDYMIPNKSAFISYYPVSGRWIRMGNDSFVPILGHRSAIISSMARRS